MALPRVATIYYLKYRTKNPETFNKRMTHTQGENQATGIACDSDQISDLTHKDFKVAIINMFK